MPYIYQYPQWDSLSTTARTRIAGMFALDPRECWCHYPEADDNLCLPGMATCETCGYCANYGDNLVKQAEFARLLYDSQIPCACMPSTRTGSIFIPYPVTADEHLVERYVAYVNTATQRRLCNQDPSRCAYALHPGCDRCMYSIYGENSRWKLVWLYRYLEALGQEFPRSVEATIIGLESRMDNCPCAPGRAIHQLDVRPGSSRPAHVEEDAYDLAPRGSDLPVSTQREDFEGFAIPAGVDWNAVKQRIIGGADVCCQPRVQCDGVSCAACLLCTNQGDTQAKLAGVRKYLKEKLSVSETALVSTLPKEVPEEPPQVTTSLQKALLARITTAMPELRDGLLVCHRYVVQCSPRTTARWALIWRVRDNALWAEYSCVPATDGSNVPVLGDSKLLTELYETEYHAIISLWDPAAHRLLAGSDICRIMTQGITGYSPHVLWCSQCYALAEGKL